MKNHKGKSASPRPRSRPKSASARRAEQARFLEAIRSTGSITGAAGATKTSWQTHRQWIATDPTYAAAFEAVDQDVEEELTDTLQHALVRQALDGVEEPVFYKGEQVGVTQKPSVPAARNSRAS